MTWTWQAFHSYGVFNFHKSICLSRIIRGVNKKFVHFTLCVIYQKIIFNDFCTRTRSPLSLSLSLSLSDRIHFTQRFFHCSKQCCISFFDKSFRSFVVSRFMFSTFSKCSSCTIIFTLGNKKSQKKLNRANRRGDT